MSSRASFCFLLVIAALFNGIDSASADVVYVKEFSVPTPASGPLGITVDRNGDVWFAESNASAIGRFNPTSLAFKEYATPTRNSGPELIISDGSDSLWFTERIANKIARFNTITETFTEYEVPTPKANPTGIIRDKKGYVWFTEFTANKLGRLDPKTRNITEFKVPTDNAGPLGITLDSDGNIWFTEAYAKKIAKFSPTQSRFTEYSFEKGVFSPVGIAVNENVVWFADHGSSQLGKLDLSSGTLTKYATSPAEAYPVSLPNGLSIDRNGHLWLSEHAGNKIARFIPSESIFIEYTIPSGPISVALWLALDQKGQPWFAEWATNKIGTVDISMPVPFKFVVPARDLTLETGKTTNVEINVSGMASARQILMVNMTGRPYGVRQTLSRNPVEVTPSGATTLTLFATGDARPGTYPISLSITSGKVTYTIPATLTILGKAQEVKPQTGTDLTTLGLAALAGGLVILAVFLRRRR